MADIIDLPDGEKITQPGFYRLSLERHHNQPCEGISVTSGILRTIEIETPGDVWWFHVLNEDRYDRKETDALRLGRAMHAWVEGEEEALKRDFIVLPKSAPSRPTSAQLNAENPSASSIKSMSFWEKIEARVEATGKDLISHSDFEKIREMGTALKRDPLACAVIGGEPEITMAWKDEATDLWCLSRLDNMTFDGLLSDYKRVATRGAPMSKALCRRRIKDHGYHQQLSFGAEGYMRLTGSWPTDCALVFQMESPPYHPITMAIGQDELYWGMCANHRSLAKFRECLDSGHWPGPGEDPGEFRFTEREREMMEQRQAEGDLPNMDVPEVWKK